jgi:hypothetical protein
MTTSQNKKEFKTKTKLPFIRAFEFILRDKSLSSGEKLTLCAIFRFWPKPTTNTNKCLAELLGFTERYIEMTLAKLRKKNRISVRYITIEKAGKPYTCRAISPVCFPSGIPNSSSGNIPNSSSDTIPKKPVKHTEQEFDLQEYKENNKEEPAPALAVQGQPSPAVEKFKQQFGIGRRKEHIPLSEKEFDRRRNNQQKALGVR